MHPMFQPRPQPRRAQQHLSLACPSGPRRPGKDAPAVSVDVASGGIHVGFNKPNHFASKTPVLDRSPEHQAFAAPLKQRPKSPSLLGDRQDCQDPFIGLLEHIMNAPQETDSKDIFRVSPSGVQNTPMRPPERVEDVVGEDARDVAKRVKAWIQAWGTDKESESLASYKSTCQSGSSPSKRTSSRYAHRSLDGFIVDDEDEDEDDIEEDDDDDDDFHLGNRRSRKRLEPGTELHQPAHSFVMLVGPPGCGKSAIIQAVSLPPRLMHPRSPKNATSRF